MQMTDLIGALLMVKFNGQVSKTFLRGECVWDGKKFLLGKKTGQFIPRRNSNFFDYY